MTFPKTKDISIEQEGRKFTTYIIEFENAVLGFFFEGEDRKIGTVAVATPRTNTTTGSSSVLLGYRNNNITRLLAEQLAAKYRELALSSLFTQRDNDTVAGRVFMKLTQSLEQSNLDSKPNQRALL